MALKQSVMIPALARGLEDKATLIEQVAAIGLDAIELHERDAEFDGLCDAAASHGLRVASFIGQASLPDGLNNSSQPRRYRG